MSNLPRWVKCSPHAYIPSKGTPNSVGYDLRLLENTVIVPGTDNFIDVGVGVIPPEGYYAQLLSRSGLAKQGITTEAGVIDPDYRGSIRVIVYNNGAAHPMLAGDAISQLVFIKYCAPSQSVTLSMEEFKAQATIRGANGFGSTSSSATNINEESQRIKCTGHCEDDCEDCDVAVYNQVTKVRDNVKRQKSDSEPPSPSDSYHSNPEYGKTPYNTLCTGQPSCNCAPCRLHLAIA